MPHLVLTGMGTIFPGNQFLPWFVLSVEKLFLRKMKLIIFKKLYNKLIWKQPL